MWLLGTTCHFEYAEWRISPLAQGHLAATNKYVVHVKKFKAALNILSIFKYSIKG